MWSYPGDPATGKDGASSNERLGNEQGDAGQVDAVGGMRDTSGN
jgi:hypothetical protein